MTQEAVEKQQVANPEAVVAESEAGPAPVEGSAEPDTQVASPESQTAPAATDTPTETAPSETPAAPVQTPQSLPGDLQRIQQAEARATAAEQRMQQSQLEVADGQAHAHFLDQATRMYDAAVQAGTDEKVARDSGNQFYNTGMAQFAAFKSQQQVERQVPQMQELMGQRVATVLAAAKEHGIEPLDLFNATQQTDATQIGAHAAQMSEMTKMRGEIAQLKTGQANTAVPPNQTFANTNGAGTMSDEAFTLHMADQNATLTDADFKRWTDMGKSG